MVYFTSLLSFERLTNDHFTVHGLKTLSLGISLVLLRVVNSPTTTNTAAINISGVVIVVLRLLRIFDRVVLKCTPPNLTCFLASRLTLTLLQADRDTVIKETKPISIISPVSSNLKNCDRFR